MLSGEECLQCADEEFGQRVLWNFGLVESGWAFAYGAQNDNGFIGTDGFFGSNFYTQDKTTGVITPVECSSDGCQSTMLSCLDLTGFAEDHWH